MKNTRSIYHRMKIIDDAIRQKTFPNCRSLAELLEVSQKSIQRDLEYMRDMLGAPIRYNPQKRGYEYSESGYYLPAVFLKTGEKRALRILNQALEPYISTPYFSEIKQAVDKVFESLPITRIEDKSQDLVSFEPPPSSEVDPENFQMIDEAVQNKIIIRLTYYSASSDQTKLRTIHPYHLHNDKGIWYVIAYCETRRAIRFFALNRISNLTLTEKLFQVQTDFHLNNYLKDAFDMVRQETPMQVELKFSAYQARWIRERVWHASQELLPQPDGSLVVRFKSSGLDSLKRWILRYGAEVEVLQPEELRQAIRDEIQKMGALYEEQV
jgi:predicted DNA-binding transcriptional regulator YafY